MNKERLVALLEIVGAVLVVGGAAWFSPKAGLIAFGVVLIVAAQLVDREPAQPSPE